MLLYLCYHTETANQLSCYNFCLISDLESDCSDKVLSVDFFLDFINDVTVFGERLKLNRQHSSLRFSYLIISKLENDEAVGGDVELFVGREISKLFE